jgi:hypothetical protein
MTSAVSKSSPIMILLGEAAVLREPPTVGCREGRPPSTLTVRPRYLSLTGGIETNVDETARRLTRRGVP